MNRETFSFLIPPLLLIAALLQSTTAARLRLQGVKPDLVLLLVVIGTLIYGVRPGLGWAFVGGICLDIFSGGPTGSSSLALLPAALLAGMGHGVFSRFNAFVPLIIAALSTLAYNVTYVGVLTFLNQISTIPLFSGYPIPQIELAFASTLQRVTLPSMFYNTALMLFLLPVLNRVPETPVLE